MKELVVISGKGGTGKTSIMASLAVLAKSAVLADCDVDAADLHLIMRPVVRERHDFIGGKRAVIDMAMCRQCGRCAEVCRFEAIERVPDEKGGECYRVDPVSCEGCKVCVVMCPAGAIGFEDCVNGQWYISDTRCGTMVHAELGVAEENSGKLVTLLRRRGREIAQAQGKDWLIIDGSPGLGCPVIASVTGADGAVIVTEPTLSGKHDFERVAQLAARFRLAAWLCINKADINPGVADEIEAAARRHGVKVAGRIKYDEVVTQAQIAGKAVVEYGESEAAGAIKQLWGRIQEELIK